MVWFQCEDCGENLKKPKLQNHFYRCSSHKLSCIDCGVVFDQQSVQAHTSCVTETEKYGPKTTSRFAPLQSKEIEKQIDCASTSTLGLSTSAPWTCSLCNVNTTSIETLELHSQGKKHCKKVKAATASAIKEKDTLAAVSSSGGKDGVPSALRTEACCLTNNIGMGNGSLVIAVSEEALVNSERNVAVDEIRPSSAEKKRKKAAADVGAGAGGHDSNERLQSKKHDKKQRRIEGLCAGEADGFCRSPEKKRKHAEEQHGSFLGGEATKSSLKKCRKGGKHELASEPLLDAKVAKQVKIVEEDSVGCGRGEQHKTKGTKGRQKHSTGSQCPELYSCDKNGHASGARIAPVDEASRLGTLTGTADVPVEEKIKSGKKAKKMKQSSDPESGLAQLDVKVSEIVNGGRKLEKDETSKKTEKSGNIAHEVSFRAWLGDEDGDAVDGKVLRQPSAEFPASGNGSSQRDGKAGGEATAKGDNLEAPSKRSAQARIAKVVKWKRIIREVFAKLIQSVNGRLKRKELTRAVLPLAQKAISSSALSVDRKTLKAELMRQVSSSPKFVLEGKHISIDGKHCNLSSKAK